ncbi:MAG: D-glycero-alpha-D-manno-heptose-1,7-bisphosphate 7-phosphatase [Bacteroidia bacterium]
MIKAVFLDRDGVLNRDFLPYHFRKDQFFINRDVWESLRKIKKKGYAMILITNQGGIAKGLYTKVDVDVLHKDLIKTAAENEIEFLEVYFCPHHDLFGKCLCRKPGSVMLEKALARFNIDPVISYFIGDTERDVFAGLKAGVQTIKIIPNQSLLKVIDLIK